MKELDTVAVNQILSGIFIMVVLVITGMWFHFSDKKKGRR